MNPNPSTIFSGPTISVVTIDRDATKPPSGRPNIITVITRDKYDFRNG
jgi:hypothetical protein